MFERLCARQVGEREKGVCGLQMPCNNIPSDYQAHSRWTLMDASHAVNAWALPGTVPVWESVSKRPKGLDSHRANSIGAISAAASLWLAGKPLDAAQEASLAAITSVQVASLLCGAEPEHCASLAACSARTATAWLSGALSLPSSADSVMVDALTLQAESIAGEALDGYSSDALAAAAVAMIDRDEARATALFASSIERLTPSAAAAGSSSASGSIRRALGASSDPAFRRRRLRLVMSAMRQLDSLGSADAAQSIEDGLCFAVGELAKAPNHSNPVHLLIDVVSAALQVVAEEVPTGEHAGGKRARDVAASAQEASPCVAAAAIVGPALSRVAAVLYPESGLFLRRALLAVWDSAPASAWLSLAGAATATEDIAQPKTAAARLSAPVLAAGPSCTLTTALVLAVLSCSHACAVPSAASPCLTLQELTALSSAVWAWREHDSADAVDMLPAPVLPSVAAAAASALSRGAVPRAGLCASLLVSLAQGAAADRSMLRSAAASAAVVGSSSAVAGVARSLVELSRRVPARGHELAVSVASGLLLRQWAGVLAARLDAAMGGPLLSGPEPGTKGGGAAPSASGVLCFELCSAAARRHESGAVPPESAARAVCLLVREADARDPRAGAQAGLEQSELLPGTALPPGSGPAVVRAAAEHAGGDAGATLRCLIEGVAGPEAAPASSAGRARRLQGEESVTAIGACCLAVLLQASAQVLWASPSARPAAETADAATLEAAASQCSAAATLMGGSTNPLWEEAAKTDWRRVTARQGARLAHAASIAVASVAVAVAGRHAIAAKAEAVAESDVRELLIGLDALGEQ